jgi:hypothetical protein
MITYNKYLFTSWHEGIRVDQKGDTGLGNLLFFIAGTIGIAKKNGYDYSFPRFCATDYLVNPLSLYDDSLTEEITIPWGFNSFDFPDNKIYTGQLQSERYFEHCKDLIYHYFTLRPIVEPLKDTIVMHYRNYQHPYFHNLKLAYYLKALKHLPDRPVVVITDNLEAAYKELGSRFEYVSSTPIEDFYLGCNADYVVMANSSFSWWWAWFCKMRGGTAVAPWRWFTDECKQETKDIYCKEWIKV